MTSPARIRALSPPAPRAAVEFARFAVMLAMAFWLCAEFLPTPAFDACMLEPGPFTWCYPGVQIAHSAVVALMAACFGPARLGYLMVTAVLLAFLGVEDALRRGDPLEASALLRPEFALPLALLGLLWIGRTALGRLMSEGSSGRT